ncbi:extracellular solute-binding protein [Paenibacillus sepulcri]|uniref:Extracellular solute-binding protein n=1 Tax=Paenibacillus sepulcri TaxID=359917 RepID=A0ABS7CFH1_9BACL|nr:extracellular solute-binding protein [Paenibacillus sepulcri]
MKKILTGVQVLIILILLAACSSGNQPAGGGGNIADSNKTDADETVTAGSGAKAEPAGDFKKLGDEPLTLSFVSLGATFTDVEFQIMIADPIRKKYPNVTIERIKPVEGSAIEEVLSTYTPDILFSSVSQRIVRTGAFEDLRELIKRHHFDESRLKPVAYNYIKEVTRGKGEEIFALPFNVNQHVLYYNKDIFDHFGEPYPTEKQLT